MSIAPDPEIPEEETASDQMAEFLAEAMNSLGEFESLTGHLWGIPMPGENPEVARLQAGNIRFTDVSVCVTQFVDQAVQITFVVNNPLDERIPIVHISWLYKIPSDDDEIAAEAGDPTLMFGIGPDEAAEVAALENEALHRAIFEVDEYTDHQLIDNINRCLDVGNGGIEAKEGSSITTHMSSDSLRKFYFSLMTCIAAAS